MSGSNNQDTQTIDIGSSTVSVSSDPTSSATEAKFVYSSFTGSGSFITLTTGDLTFSDFTFSIEKAIGGSALCSITENGIFHLKNMIIESNSQLSHGGNLISLGSYGILNPVETTFQNFKMNGKSLISLDSTYESGKDNSGYGGSIEPVKCKFVNISSTGDGAVLKLSLYHTVVLSDMTFINCSSEGSGGGGCIYADLKYINSSSGPCLEYLYVIFVGYVCIDQTYDTSVAGSLELSYMTFTNCTASNGYGGALYLKQSGSNRVILQKSSFYTCKAKRGGGIYLYFRIYFRREKPADNDVFYDLKFEGNMEARESTNNQNYGEGMFLNYSDISYLSESYFSAFILQTENNANKESIGVRLFLIYFIWTTLKEKNCSLKKSLNRARL